MVAHEGAIQFSCGNDELIGILHPVERPSRRGVVIVVGGGQYRVGAHRQFLLLARCLAQAGVPVFRFDLRGMGDSGGKKQRFTELSPEIKSAVDCFVASTPDIDSIVLWGLCDGASAAAIYAPDDSRINGLILVNPWVTTEKGVAKTYLKHYYPARLLSVSFWVTLLKGQVSISGAVKSFYSALKSANANKKTKYAEVQLPHLVFTRLEQFSGRMLIVLSGRDLTAREFEDAIVSTPEFSRLQNYHTIEVKKHPDADHTFSAKEWRNTLLEWTRDWLLRKPDSI